MRWFDDSRASRPVDILVVCTGNICRSPYITALLGAGLPELVISSAGSSALVGAAPVVQVVQSLAERGVDPSFPPARSLTRSMVRGARLIITAARFHRTQVVALDRNARERAFTLKELARVTAANTGAQGFEAVVAVAASMARTVETIDYDDDLVDPTGLPWTAYERMTTEVDAALGVLIPALRRRTRSG